MKIFLMLKRIVVCCLFLLSANVGYEQPPFAWASSMGGSRNEQAKAVAIDSVGNVYSTGVFKGTADFDPGAGVYNLTSLGDNDIFISKLSPLGKFIWAKRIGGKGDDEVESIAVDNSGNVYTTGEFNDSVDFNPGAGIYNLIAHSQGDAFISKLDSSGSFVLGENFGGIYPTYGTSIAVDVSQNIYFTGSFLFTVDFDPGVGIYDLTAPFGYFDGFIAKLNASGDLIWANKIDGPQIIARHIAIDALQNIYTVGQFSDTADFQPGSGSGIVVATGTGSYWDIFVAKFNASGNFSWAKSFGGHYDETVNSLSLDVSGNIYTTGQYEDSADFDPGIGHQYLPGTGYAYICKLDSSGGYKWAKSIGGTTSSAYANGYSVATDAYKNVYTTGYFMGVVDFDPGTGVYNLPHPPSQEDFFISKLDSFGDFVWAVNIGGAFASSLKLDQSGNIYTCGGYGNTVDFDPSSSGIYNLAAVDSSDIFVVKLGNNTLPVHLLTFTARLQDKQTLLNWTVENEQSFDRYEVERSYNGSEFNKIGSVAAINARAYNYTDNNPTTTPNTKPQTIFYRLKLIDKDGKFTYSKIEKVSYNNQLASFTLFPNPAHISIQLLPGKNMKGSLSIAISDMSGKIVLQQTASANDGNIAINTGKLSAGTYTVKVINNGEVFVQKLVVE